jgi:hypothetical protein
MMEVKVKIGKTEQMLRGSGFTFELCKFNKALDKKTNKPYGWQSYRYYSSLESALKDILRGKVAASEANTLTELKQQITKAQDELKGYYEENV